MEEKTASSSEGSSESRPRVHSSRRRLRRALRNASSSPCPSAVRRNRSVCVDASEKSSGTAAAIEAGCCAPPDTSTRPISGTDPEGERTMCRDRGSAPIGGQRKTWACPGRDRGAGRHEKMLLPVTVRPRSGTQSSKEVETSSRRTRTARSTSSAIFSRHQAA